MDLESFPEGSRKTGSGTGDFRQEVKRLTRKIRLFRVKREG